MIQKMCRECGKPYEQFNTTQTRCPLCCYNRYAKPKKPLKRMGNHAMRWARTRRRWFKQNPSDFYDCYLCGKTMSVDETTLDHVLPRSHRPDLRYEYSNLKPCCYMCNMKKGSKH